MPEAPQIRRDRVFLERALAIIEKDRTGLYDVGHIVENPTYKSFAAAVNGKGKRVHKHQSEEEAVENDSLFFAEHEAAQNGRITYHSLLVQLAKIGLGEMVAQYKTYALDKYDLDELIELEAADIKEQMLLLKQCAENDKKMTKFIELLNNQEE